MKRDEVTCKEVEQALIRSIEGRWTHAARYGVLPEDSECELCTLADTLRGPTVSSCTACPLYVFTESSNTYKGHAGCSLLWNRYLATRSGSHKAKKAARAVRTLLEDAKKYFFPEGWGESK